MTDFEVTEVGAVVAAYERGRIAGLREAASIAEGWYRNMGKSTPQDEIIAHIPDAQEPDGWQDISTAPKDGTVITVVSFSYGVWWDSSEAWWDCDSNRWENGEDYDEWPLTHWMPLPAPDAPEPERLLARHQPCGCIVCYCSDDEFCLGCGSRNCGTHGAGMMPNPVYADAPPAQEAEE